MKEIEKQQQDTVFEISNQDSNTCDTQGDLYEYVFKENYDIIDFSDKYLASDFCNREMDSLYSVFQREDPLQILDFVIPQIGDLFPQTENPFHTPYWGAWDLGYMYRYLHYSTGMHSKDIVSCIDTKTMIQEMDKHMDWNLEEIADVVVSEYLQPEHDHHKGWLLQKNEMDSNIER